MIILKEAKVVRFFETHVALNDNQIAEWLGKGKNGVAVNPYGAGGYPTVGVFHYADQFQTWTGSRISEKVIAFYGETENDKIFASAIQFSEEITGSKLEKAKVNFINHVEALEMNEVITEARVKAAEKKSRKAA